MLTFEQGQTIKFWYKNWKGEESFRTATVKDLTFGSTSYHPNDQWLLNAWDEDKQAHRTFAIADMSLVRRI